MAAMTQQALSSYLDTYGDMVLRIAFSYTKNKMDAEDVTQDVFLKMFDKKPVFMNADHEKAWLIRVTVNLCKNRLKSFWNTKTGALSEMLPAQDGPAQDDTLLQAVMTLPASQRTAVYLFYYEGYSTAEIAPLLDKKESTVRSLLHRAREGLRKRLKEEYDDALL